MEHTQRVPWNMRGREDVCLVGKREVSAFLHKNRIYIIVMVVIVHMPIIWVTTPVIILSYQYLLRIFRFFKDSPLFATISVMRSTMSKLVIGGKNIMVQPLAGDGEE